MTVQSLEFSAFSWACDLIGWSITAGWQLDVSAFAWDHGSIALRIPIMMHYLKVEALPKGGCHKCCETLPFISLRAKKLRTSTNRSALHYTFLKKQAPMIKKGAATPVTHCRFWQETNIYMVCIRTKK